MKFFSRQCILIILLFLVKGMMCVKQERRTCKNRGNCFLKPVTCPVECPTVQPTNPKAKGCYLDCFSPKCEATCRIEAKQVAKWDDGVDQFQFSYDGKALAIPKSHLSEWKSPEQELTVERTSSKNSVTVTLPDMAEISMVEGILGRTYRPDFKNPAKPGVAMPVVGGEDKYRTSSLLLSDCATCSFSPAGVQTKENSLLIDYGTLDCTNGVNSGNGIVCRK